MDAADQRLPAGPRRICTSPHNMLADMVLTDIQLEFAVASNTSETADDVLDPYLLVAVLLSDEFFAPGGR